MKDDLGLKKTQKLFKDEHVDLNYAHGLSLVNI